MSNKGAFKLDPYYFKRPHAFFVVAVVAGMTLFGLQCYKQAWFPYAYLGILGEILKQGAEDPAYLVYFRGGFWLAWGIHVLEAIQGYRIASRIGLKNAHWYV
eukprot:Colp12_sorted_trinity150504_noHs@27963